MHIYKRVQKIRNLKQISRHDLTKGIVSYSHFCNFESGRHQLSDDILIALAKRLDIPNEYLLNHNIKSRRLNELLILFEELLKDENFKEAETIMNNIDETYPYINSTFQEICFFLLKSYLLYKTQKTPKAIDFFEINAIPLLDEKDLKYFTDTFFLEIYYYLLATSYFYKNEYVKSYNIFFKYLNSASSELSKANAYYNLSVSSYKIQNLPNAISFAKQALDIYLDELALEKIFSAHNLLGSIYLDSDQLDIAESHFMKASDIAKKLDSNDFLERIYHNLGLLFKAHKNYDTALEHLYMSLELKKQSNNNINITYYAIINIYISKLDIERAEAILTEAKALCTNEDDIYYFKEFMALIYFHKKEYYLYKKYMEEAFEYFHNIKNKKEVWYICDNLGIYYEGQRKYKKACYFYKAAFDFLNMKEE